MFELLLWLGCLPVPIAVYIAYRRTRDPLHPLMYLGPMIFYVYCFVPLVLYYRGLIANRFPEDVDLASAQAYIFLGIVCFCLGALWPRVPAATVDFRWLDLDLSPVVRRRLVVLSYCLGAMGVGAYFYMLADGGGFAQAYKFSKGGVHSASGYLATAPFLSIPAIMLYLLAERGEKLSIKTVLILLVFISPHLLHGLLAASRGTIFLALGTLLFAWYLTAPKRPSVLMLVVAIVGIGVLMLFLKSQRKEIHVGSQFEFSRQAFVEYLFPATDTAADDASYTLGTILVSREYGHNWGMTYVTHLLVRPVPKQWWPTKYEFMANLFGEPDTDRQWLSKWRRAVGWEPNLGSATGFVADTYVEFAWGGLILCYLMGFFYGWLWKQSIVRTGMWPLLYFEACVVSVYLPTQGLASAWGYRFVFLAVPTILVWKGLVSPIAGRLRRIPVAPAPLVQGAV